MAWNLLSNFMGGDPFVDSDLQDRSAQVGPPLPPDVGPPYAMGNAPDPSYYAQRGKLYGSYALNLWDADGAGTAALGQDLVHFHRGGELDAQASGGSRAYGNYTFGVYNAAAGVDLPSTLAAANAYGKMFGSYDPRQVTMDKTYTAIPADNVANITRGYGDYHNGTLWQKPR